MNPVETCGEAPPTLDGESPSEGNQSAEAAAPSLSDEISTSTSTGRPRQESLTSDAAVVSKRDLLQEREPSVIEDDALASPIQLLPGETLRRLGRSGIAGGIIMLTTYRLFITFKESFVNIPLRVIEYVSCVDVDSISATCKDGTVRMCKLASSEACFKWLHAIKHELAYCRTFVDYFAVSFSITAHELKYPPWNLKSGNPYKLGEELDRLGFDLKNTWRISNINENYKLCSSYPKENVVPRSYPEELLEKAAPFRARCRFPTVVWRNTHTGTVLARCSQPELGVFCQRSTEDEELIQAIIETCDAGDSTSGTDDGVKKLLVVDARSYSSAIANRAKGGGTEYTEYYKHCDIEFMALPNIHSVRSSFAAVRSLISGKASTTNWYSSLEATNWLTNLSTLISAAKHVVETLVTKPVLVHCSDGWDRTPQICSLAQIIMDPFYRTYKGFQILIAKEWLSFGHKFAQRCGHALGEFDPNEVSPIFLQWLDAVYQLTQQFPTAFEFNEACLIKLVQHTYSCMFGTFLCDSEGIKVCEEFHTETVEVWSLLDALKSQLSNILYTPNVHKTLDVSSHQSDLRLWTSVYSPQTSQANCLEAPIENRQLRRSRSFTDISSSTETNLHQVLVGRTLSDPDLSSSCQLSIDNASGLAVSGSTASGGGKIGSTISLSNLRNEGRSRNNSEASGKESETRQKTENKSLGDGMGIMYDRYIDIDGLPYHVNPAIQGVVEMANNYEKEIDKLKRQIKYLQTLPAQQGSSECNNCHGLPILKFQNADGDCAPGSAGSNCSDQSDGSWETLSFREPNVRRWMPDHAVSHCCMCNAKFTVIRRKHHCRQCGEIFCDFCASEFAPIPEQQLFDPVRVCRNCHRDLSMAVDSLSEELDQVDDMAEDISHESHGTEASFPDDRHWTNSSSPASSTPRKPSAVTTTTSPSAKELLSQDACRTSAHKAGHVSTSSGGSQKTCSQESINVENCIDGKRLMGAQV